MALLLYRIGSNISMLQILSCTTKTTHVWRKCQTFPLRLDKKSTSKLSRRADDEESDDNDDKVHALSQLFTDKFVSV